MTPPPLPPVPSLRVAGIRRRLFVAVTAWVVLIGASAAFVAHTQAEARRGVDQRFALRATIASRFVGTYLRDLITRQADQAARHLASPRVTRQQFEHTVTDAGFGAAVLLDSRGRVLQVAPAKQSLIGQDLAARYDHLRAAVDGRVAVSKVVPSAARRHPVVAVALPFPTPMGDRVYSGAYNVSHTPLGTYVRNAIPTPESRTYLIDPSGVVIASSRKEAGGFARLRDVDPALASALGEATHGSYDRRGREQRFASEPIAGTPWRLVVALPSNRLYASIGGATRWVAWAALIGFALMSLIAVALYVRNAVDRVRLAALNGELERLAAVDALTGLSNRRQITNDLAQAVSAARRHHHELAVLLIDLDHFKDVNDTFGHQAGDRALAASARVMEAALRREDLVGRWGGEEFIAVLPATDLDGAVVVAERIRAGIAELEVPTDGALPLRLSASVGVATDAQAGADSLVDRADAALYAAKDAGRNRVEVALVPAAEPAAMAL